MVEILELKVNTFKGTLRFAARPLTRRYALQEVSLYG